MMRADIKYAIFNRRMFIAMIIGFLCLFFAGSEFLWTENSKIDFVYTFFMAMSSGSTAVISLIYPILSCMPYADNYLLEETTGYYLYKKIKVSLTRYSITKIIATAISGGISICIPVCLYFLVCLSFRGNGVSSERFAYITWNVNFFEKYPLVYCGVYIVNSFVCGAIFSLLGLMLSAFIKNRYLVVILPVIIYIFFNILCSNTFFKFNSGIILGYKFILWC